MRGKTCSSQQAETQSQQQGNPLCLGEAAEVWTVGITARKLEKETACGVTGNVSGESGARNGGPHRHHPSGGGRQAQNPDRLHGLDGKQPYTGELEWESHFRVGVGVPYPHPAGAPVTAARKETPDASPCVKQARAGDRDIEVRQHWLMQASQRQGDSGKNANHVTIEDEPISPGKNL